VNLWYRNPLRNSAAVHYLDTTLPAGVMVVLFAHSPATAVTALLMVGSVGAVAAAERRVSRPSRQAGNASTLEPTGRAQPVAAM
jgi:hypothetical protein